MKCQRTQEQIPLVDLTAQLDTLGPALDEAVRRALRRGDYILGEELGRFEAEFAAYCEAPHAVGVSSGLSALELILQGYRIGPGDEVILPANTFIATALAVTRVGATPVLVDVEEQSHLIDVAALRSAITPRTRAVIPVHLFGQVADMDAITGLARERGLVVIEDACQAHGARYKGRRAGSLGDAAAFSFYPAKNLGCYGDGGMVVTSDARLAEMIHMLRNYGQREKYHHVLLGGNQRLDTLQAALLRVKLPYLDGWNAARRAAAARYTVLLAGGDVTPPAVARDVEPVWHLYVVRSRRRDDLRAHLARHGIATGIHYPIPIHLQEAYSQLGYARGAFPVTERLSAEILSLPMYAELAPVAVDRIVAAIGELAPGEDARATWVGAGGM